MLAALTLASLMALDPSPASSQGATSSSTASSSTASSSTASTSDGAVQTLKGGVTVEPLLIDGVKGLRAEFRVDAPPDVVLQTLWDVHRFRSIFPDIKKLDVVAEHDSEIDASFTVDAVLETVHYTLRRAIDRSARNVTWKNIAGDLKYVRGSWSVRPADASASSSIVTYTSFVDVGTFVPTGMVRDIAMSKVEQMAARVRQACADAAKSNGGASALSSVEAH